MKDKYFATLLGLISLTGAVLQPANSAEKSSYDEKRKAELRDGFAPRLSELERDLAKNPRNCAASAAKATILQEIGSDSEALTLINQLALDYPDSNAVWWNRSIIYRHLGNNQESLKSLDRAIKLQPKVAEYWRLKAMSLSDIKHYAEAWVAADQACKLATNSDQNVGARCDLELRLKRWQQAIDDATVLLKLHEHVPKGAMKQVDDYLRRASGYMALKNYKSALADCLSAEHLWPDDRKVRTALLQVYTAMGDLKNANAERVKLRELDDDLKPLK